MIVGDGGWVCRCTTVNEAEHLQCSACPCTKPSDEEIARALAAALGSPESVVDLTTEAAGSHSSKRARLAESDDARAASDGARTAAEDDDSRGSTDIDDDADDHLKASRSSRAAVPHACRVDDAVLQWPGGV